MLYEFLNKPSRLLFLVLIFFAVSFSPNLSFAESLIINQLSMSKEFLTISFESFATNEINMKSIIEDDINLKMTYNLKVLKQGGFLVADETITNIMLRYSVKKDIINNGYKVIAYENQLAKARWFDSMEELLGFLLKLQNYRLLDLSRLNEVDTYFVEVSQEIVSLELYPPLSLIFNLIGKWNYYSPKIRSKFFNRKGISNE